MSAPDRRSALTIMLTIPDGMTCSDCVHYEPKCSWLLGFRPDSMFCDWTPIQFAARVKRAEETEEKRGK